MSRGSFVARYRCECLQTTDQLYAIPHQGMRRLNTPNSIIIMFDVKSSIPVKTMSVKPTGKTRPSTSRRRPGLLVFAEGEPPTTASRKPPYLFNKIWVRFRNMNDVVEKQLTTEGYLPTPPSKTRHPPEYGVSPLRSPPELPPSALGSGKGGTCYPAFASLSSGSC